MPTLRFSGEAELQLQMAYHQLATSPRRQSDYSLIVSTLARLEANAALFTLLEATALPSDAANLFGVILESTHAAHPITIVYGLTATDEDVVIYSIRW